MPFFKNERNWVILLLAVLFIVFVKVVFSTQSSFGGGDHYEHFKLALYGWKYPRLLFSHWGKPVFTILISPFAQFGINAARTYNVLVGLLTAFITWRLATYFKFRYAWLAIPFVVFTPIYFATMFAVLTEITFSFFLVFSIYLFFKNRFILSALVLSFLPLVRTEGVILFPLFILAYSLKKEFKALPFLLTGFLVISALGSPFYESFWWLITEMPYTGGAKEMYGSGSLWHFVNHTPNITGGPMAILFIAGLIALAITWAKNKETKLNQWFYFALLIPGSFLIFFAAHSFVWWQGMGNSLGLIRVIASVSPLAALTAVFGLQYFLGFNFRYRNIFSAAIITFLIFWVVIDGVKKHQYGFQDSDAERLLKKASDFIKENQLENHKIFYFNGYIIFPLEIDPYQRDKSQQWYNNNQPNPAQKLPDSSIIVWDAMFGPNDGGVQLEMLENQDGIETLAVFKPEFPFKVLGGYEYEVVIFRKNNSLKKNFASHIHEDFEGSQFAKTDKIFSGEKSMFVNEKYFSLCQIAYGDISQNLLPLTIKVSFSMLLEKKLKDRELALVCSLEQFDTIIDFQVFDSFFANMAPGNWVTDSLVFSLPQPIAQDNTVKVYFYNKEFNSFYIDDIDINFNVNY